MEKEAGSNLESVSAETLSYPSQSDKENNQTATNANQVQKQQDLLLDFSSMFKKKGNFVKRPPKNKNTQNKTPNWILQIPTKLDVTIGDLQNKSVLDMRKWMTITKTGESYLKPIAAVCSCWNYLCSDRGLGKNSYLCFKKCLEMVTQFLKIQQIQQVNEFGRYCAIQKIVQALNNSGISQAKLQVSLSVKLAEPRKLGGEATNQKQCLLQGLKNNKDAYIYLAYQDIFCPVGFDKTPLKQLQAYEKIENIQPQDQQLWIINSTLGRNQPSFCTKRWSDIQKDLETVWPSYLDIKQAKQGVRVRPDAKQQEMNQNRGTSNCIIRVSIQ